MKDKIYITGCAKSGTTLFKRLFLAFEDIQIIRNESGIYDFAKSKSNKILVGKRRWDTVYSSSRINQEEVNKQLKLFKQMKVINIIRDGRDVIESYRKSWNMNGYYDWIESIEQFFEHQKYLAFNIRYEDILREPDRQQNILADRLNLKIKYKWSEYPNFLFTEKWCDEDVSWQSPKYIPRKFDIGNINNGNAYLNTPSINQEYFTSLLVRLGYS